MSNYRKAIDPEIARGADSAFEWFPMAEAHWKLGNKAQAYEWYDRGSEWLEKHQPDDPELAEAREQVASLLGITQSKSLSTSKSHDATPKNVEGEISSSPKTND
jgi:hypothetical protein